MRKMAKLLSTIGLIFCTLLIIHIVDLKQKDNYVNISSYDVKGIVFENDLELDYKKMEEILKFAKEEEVVFVKLKESKNSGIAELYLSTEAGAESINFLSNSNIVKNTSNDFLNSHITTQKSDIKNSYAYIEDFLDNNTYNYYTIKDLIENEGYIFGSYAIYYQNSENYENFINKVVGLLDTNREVIELPVYQVSRSAGNYFILILLGIFILELIFHFIFQVFNMYSQSKKISVMKLLGYNDITLFSKLVKMDVLILITVSLLTLLFCLFLPNINIMIFLFILIFQILFITITMLSCFLSVKVVTRKQDIINLLKNKIITEKISILTFGFKCFVTIIVTILLAIEIVNLQSYLILKNEQNNYQYIDEYAYFPNINFENKEYSLYEKFNEFYVLINDNNMECIYSDFSQFNIDFEQDERQKMAIEEKEYYPFGSIDINYLEEENLEIFDYNGNKIEITQLPKEEIMIFPESKIMEVEDFKDFYTEEYKSEYDFSVENPLEQIYIYKDKTLKTYAPTIDGSGELDAPILRKVDINSTKTYFDSPLGLNIAGSSDSTALKIKIKDSKQATYSTLLPILENVGISEALTSSNFYSYLDYFNSEIEFAFSEFSTLLLVILFVLFFYIEIIINSAKIYAEWKANTIVVKSVLGIKKIDIFKELLQINLVVISIAYFIVICLCLKFNMTNLLILLNIIFLIIIIFDLFISFMIVNRFTKKKRLLVLKGDRQ